jgi:hypothetical protein
MKETTPGYTAPRGNRVGRLPLQLDLLRLQSKQRLLLLCPFHSDYSGLGSFSFSSLRNGGSRSTKVVSTSKYDTDARVEQCGKELSCINLMDLAWHHPEVGRQDSDDRIHQFPGLNATQPHPTDWRTSWRIAAFQSLTSFATEIRYSIHPFPED